jgi:biopolymer transport protein ExbB
MLDPFAAFHNMRELGGPVVDWIFVSCLIMWLLIVERIWYFHRVLPEDVRRAQEKWAARADPTTWTSHQIRRCLISQVNASMTSNLQLLRVLVPMAPLLGLVGTVSGMLAVFDSMAALGSADARSMATGVSEAMVCTLMGLAVSITGLYPAFYFPRKAKRETARLADKLSY